MVRHIPLPACAFPSTQTRCVSYLWRVTEPTLPKPDRESDSADNAQKYRALDKLYFGLTLMTVMLASLTGTIGLDTVLN